MLNRQNLSPQATPPGACHTVPLWRQMLLDARYALLINLVFTALITYVFDPGSDLWLNFIASMCIGSIIYLLFNGIRLTLWGRERRPKLLHMVILMLLIVPVAQVAGLTLFGWLTGTPVNSIASLLPTRMISTLTFSLVGTAGAVLFFSSREKIARLEAQAAEERARAESVARQAMQAQLQLLQAQIEPHMLFNTLANLQGLISFDPDRAQLLLDQLIQYLRATLSSSRADATTLGQEFSLMEAYLGLMSIRMGARLRYALDLPDSLRQLKVPPMLLQPLVENAIQHGLEPKIDGGYIKVEASSDGAQLTLSVQDDGLGLDHPGQSKGTHLGVANIRERLQAMHGATASLSLSSNTTGGATARLTLPLPSTTTSTTP